MVASAAYGGFIPLTQQGRGGQSAGRFTSYGRDVPFNPALQRGEGLAEGFGGDYQSALARQQGMYDQFGQMAAGQGPSLAQSQLQEGMGLASQAATQQMMNARGGNAAGAQMAAASIGSSMGGQAAMQAAQLRQQEQLAAMQAQAGLAGQMAGQGLQGQLGMEGLYQQALGSQLDANLQARGLADARHNQDIERAKGIKSMFLPDLSDERAKQNIEPTQEKGGMSTASGILGALGGKAAALAPLLALSDERAKMVYPGNLAASQAVGEMTPSAWEYREGFGPTGQRNFGVTAQDMARVYPQATQDIGGYKHIDVAREAGLTLAATAEQEQRIRKLEAALAAAGPGLGAAGGMMVPDRWTEQGPAAGLARPGMGMGGMG